ELAQPTKTPSRTRFRCCAFWASMPASLRHLRPSLAVLFRGRGFPLLTNTRSFTAQVTQVVELGAAHVTAASNLDLVNCRSMQRESTFHTNTEGDLSHDETFTHTAALASKNNALEDLDT